MGKGKAEGGIIHWIATGAALLVLFSALVDPQLSVALAVAGMFALSFFTKDALWKKLQFAAASAAVSAVIVLALNHGTGITPESVAIGALVGIAIIATILHNRRKGQLLNDERTVAVSNRAHAYSWWVSYLAIAALFWFDYSGYAKLTAMQLGGALLFTMLISYAAIRGYLMHKGEG